MVSGQAGVALGDVVGGQRFEDATLGGPQERLDSCANSETDERVANARNVDPIEDSADQACNNEEPAIVEGVVLCPVRECPPSSLDETSGSPPENLDDLPAPVPLEEKTFSGKEVDKSGVATTSAEAEEVCDKIQSPSFAMIQQDLDDLLAPVPLRESTVSRNEGEGLKDFYRRISGTTTSAEAGVVGSALEVAGDSVKAGAG